MDSAEKFLRYIASVRRYSPRTCTIYRDVLLRFIAHTAPSDTPGITAAPAPAAPAVDALDAPSIITAAPVPTPAAPDAPSTLAPAVDALDAPSITTAATPAPAPLAPSLLTPDSIRNYEVYLMDEEGLDARTVNLHLSVLSSWCRFLVREGELKTNPVHIVKRPRQDKRLPEFYRDEAIRKYFDSHRGTMQYAPYKQQLNYMIVSLLEGTAIRRAELIALNNSSLDRSRRILHIRGKGDKMREIPVVDSLFEEISLYLQTKLTNGKCSDGPEAPLLQTASGGRLYPVFVDRAVKHELGTVASITGRRSPHVLRHTLATELLDNGADLNSIKEFLGHSSLAATQVYTHISVEKLKNIYNNAHPRAKNGGKHGNQSENSEI